MLCREIIAVCSETHTKHINTLCGQNVELRNVKLVVHIVTIGTLDVKLVSLQKRYKTRLTGQRSRQIFISIPEFRKRNETADSARTHTHTLTHADYSDKRNDNKINF